MTHLIDGCDFSKGDIHPEYLYSGGGGDGKDQTGLAMAMFMLGAVAGGSASVLLVLLLPVPSALATAVLTALLMAGGGITAFRFGQAGIAEYAIPEMEARIAEGLQVDPRPLIAERRAARRNALRHLLGGPRHRDERGITSIEIGMVAVAVGLVPFVLVMSVLQEKDQAAIIDAAQEMYNVTISHDHRLFGGDTWKIDGKTRSCDIAKDATIQNPTIVCDGTDLDNLVGVGGDQDTDQ